MVEKGAPAPRGLAERPEDTFRSVRCQHSATMFRRQSRPVHRAIRGALPRFSGVLGDRNPPSRLFLLYRGRSRSLFGGTKRECGVEAVGSGNYHALAGRSKYKACGMVIFTALQPCFHTSSVTALPCHLPLKGKAWLTLPYSARNFSIS